MLICVINKKRYSFTKVRDKRSVVRTLNTFINQYEYVFCDSKEIDLNIEPMVLSYKDKKIDIDNKNIVFCKNEAEIDLKNTTLICEAVDSLLSINKKEKLKKNLKKQVIKREYNGINSFFRNELLSLLEIEKLVDNEKFAKRIFSQIKNRIIFHRSGIYSERYASSSVEKKLNKNIIFPSQTSLNNILKKNLSFIINNFWLFEIDTIQRIKEVEETMSHEKFNYDYMNTSNNSTLFHPIDENEYNDLENSDIVRESAMTNAMIEHEKYGLYNKEIYEDYENLVKHYDENINQIKEYIKELIEYHQSYFRIKNIIYKKLVNRNLEYQIDLIENYYENYNNTKEVFVKKDLTSQLLIEIPNLELLKYYLKFDDILVYEIDNIIDKLLAILTDNKYMSDYEKDLFEQYTYMQDELIKMLDCKNVKGLRKNWTVESINSFISYYEKDFDIENIAEVYSHNRNDSQEFNEAENLYGLKYFDCDINSIKINKLTKNDDPFEYEGVIDNSESNDDSEMPF